MEGPPFLEMAPQTLLAILSLFKIATPPLCQHFALAIHKTDIFTRVLGIIESGFSGTRVLKLSELVLSTNESSFSEPRVSKTSESSFSESDCGNTVLDRTTTTSLCTVVVPRARRLWSRSTQKVSSRPWTSGPALRRAGNGT